MGGALKGPVSVTCPVHLSHMAGVNCRGKCTYIKELTINPLHNPRACV